MLTLEQTLNDQEDLIRLCADRELVTPEIFSPNDFYGMAKIIKRYAGLPEKRPLKGVLLHGIRLDDRLIWDAERKASLPAVFCYPPYLYRAFQEKTDKLVIPSTSPYLYMLELMKGQRFPERMGTIFFPSHSTHHISVAMDFGALANTLLKLDDKYKPITVCMYWRDFELGHHLPFFQKGFKIVSAGHIYDPDFLSRFHRLCSLHKYSASNTLGSHLFYSIKSGCSFFKIKFDFGLLGHPDVLSEAARPSTARYAEWAKLDKLFSNARATSSTEQLKIVDYYLGVESFKSPVELRTQLLYLEKLDKFGIYRPNGRKPQFMIPPFYVRVALSAARPLYNRIKKLKLTLMVTKSRIMGLWKIN